MKRRFAVIAIFLAAALPARAQEERHRHPAPEHLGTIRFAVGCAPVVTMAFDRAVALLHSFAYSDADSAFADVAARDPGCAAAHWGRAMTHYHQLWDVPVGTELAAGKSEIDRAVGMPGGGSRDRALIDALAVYYADADRIPAATRARSYSDAMARVAAAYPDDDEITVLYALSLVATAAPSDRTHARQKQAANILEPIWKRQPDHPGVPRDAALAQHDVGEAVHAMDYLTYAYLQRGQIADAARTVVTLKAMSGISGAVFKTGYAGNAMRVRLAIESRDWAAAAQLTPLPNSTPQVAALVWWARALGKLRGPATVSADADIDQLEACRDALRAANDPYWAAQSDVLLQSAKAWRLAAHESSMAAIVTMTAAADEEDGLEKLPLTPGPIVPAREQLGELLLRAGKPGEAAAAFKAALALAPGRLGALRGKAEAERQQ